MKPTTFYPGDVVRYDFDPNAISTVRDAKDRNGLIACGDANWCWLYDPSVLTLIRRKDEPVEVPKCEPDEGGEIRERTSEEMKSAGRKAALKFIRPDFLERISNLELGEELAEAGFTRKHQHPTDPDIHFGVNLGPPPPFRYVLGEREILTIEEAAAEFERGAVVFYYWDGHFWILQQEEDFCIFRATRGEDMAGFGWKTPILSIEAMMAFCKAPLYVTSSRLNLVHFREEVKS